MPADIAKLKGSIPPLITPFRSGDVDYEAYAGLVDFQINQGSHGLLVNGTTSEPSTLTVAERNKAVDVAININAGRLPIVAATGSQSLAETKVLTSHAAAAGVAALLIVTPYYIRPPQRGIIEYYLEVTRGINVPWMIYHIPGRASVSVTLDTVRELKDRSSTFVGMKHAVNDLGFVSECLDAFPEYLVFVGVEVEATVNPIRELGFTFGFTYSDTSYEDNLIGNDSGVPRDPARRLLRIKAGQSMSPIRIRVRRRQPPRLRPPNQTSLM